MSECGLLDVDQLDHVVQIVSSIVEISFDLDLRAHLLVLLDVFQCFDEAMDLSGCVG